MRATTGERERERDWDFGLVSPTLFQYIFDTWGLSSWPGDERCGRYRRDLFYLKTRGIDFFSVVYSVEAENSDSDRGGLGMKYESTYN
ncbi:hypothetical protein PDE_07623 [Penicillium oxalicum 114-2]|uniref:Uncharacterized protein n=1 Tax=Penicillium oxalicum (strain 114-2 / CGMCC 5302) TaxID=933388 RepID=S8B1H2_PENO1|nr:hypothetical protein PDE_07623 [Penicillium oxalicum 114-2]